jgi:hypothetical protein
MIKRTDWYRTRMFPLRRMDAEIARVVGLTARTVYGDVLYFNIPLYGNEEWYSMEE